MTGDLNSAAANATAEKERLKRDAQIQDIKNAEAMVTFEYTVRETRQAARYLAGYNPAPGEPIPQHMIASYGIESREKGEREELPRYVALRKQAQGLGFIVGESERRTVEQCLKVIKQ